MNMEAYVKRPGVFAYRRISTEQIPFSSAVADACKANACGRYGTCWTCPPGAGHYTELERKIKTYSNAVVFTCKYDLEDCFDFDSMMLGQQKTMALLRDIAQDLRADGHAFLALGCEGCHLCETCTYPDAPCRFPEKATVSVEACGIDVVSLSRNVDIRYNNGPNTVTYFCIILF